MNIKELVTKNRSVRRFREDQIITREQLTQLVDLARLSASGGNFQSLKYILSCDEEKNRLIFPLLKWAAYYRDWDGPEAGERPAGYIIILGDKEIGKNFFWDHGIACQSILLGATEMGLAGCIIGGIDTAELRSRLAIPDRYEILLALALGVPKEKVVLEVVGDDGSVRYWRDKDSVHHVPKRRLEDIILNL